MSDQTIEKGYERDEAVLAIAEAIHPDDWGDVGEASCRCIDIAETALDVLSGLDYRIVKLGCVRDIDQVALYAINLEINGDPAMQALP